MGTKLVDMTIQIADEKGLDTIYGIVMPENVRMIELCKKLGFNIRYTSEEVIVELNLRGRKIPEIPEAEIRTRAKKRTYLKARPPPEAKATETEPST